MNQAKHPFITLTLLVCLFALPAGLAYWFYANHKTAGQGYTNRGELITPPIDINTLKLESADGHHLSPTSKKQWMLLLFYPKTCKTSCQKALYHMRQIRLATGKDRDRIARAILTYPHQTNASLNTLLEGPFKGTLHLVLQKTTKGAQARQQIDTSTPGTLYLVDPIGNVMMRYKPNTPPDDLLKDLKLLLKVSQIG